MKSVPVPRPWYENKQEVQIAPSIFVPVRVWCEEGTPDNEAQRLAEIALKQFIKEICNEQYLSRIDDRRGSRP